MKSLFDIQKEFADALNNQDDSILNEIVSSDVMSAKEHLAIYQNSMIGVLQKTLSDIYPVCLKLVGEDFFIHMINNYISQTPSYSPDLSEYGHHFASYVAEYPGASSLVYLSDLVKLEWAWHQLFNKPDSQLFDFQKLAACDRDSQEHIVFLLPPCSELISSSYPIQKIWEINQGSELDNTTIVLEDNQVYYLFLSNNRMNAITEMQWQMLSWIQDGLTVIDICCKLAIYYPDADFTEILPYFVEQGWLVDFVIKK